MIGMKRFFWNGTGSGTGSGTSNNYTFTPLQLQENNKTVREGAVKDILNILGHEGKTVTEVKEEIINVKEKQKKEKETQLVKDKKFDELLDMKKQESDKILLKEKARGDKYENLFTTSIIKSKVISEASTQGAIDPEIVYLVLSGKAQMGEDNESVYFKDDTGNVITVQNVVKTFLESKPHFRKADFKPSSLDDKGNKNPTGEKPKEDGQLTVNTYLGEINGLNISYHGRVFDKDYYSKRDEIKSKYRKAGIK